MENNPYAPPQTVVEDPPAVSDGLARPTTVSASLNVIWGSIVLGIVGLIVKWATGQFPTAPAVLIVLVASVTMGPLVWLNIKMAARRNWARMTYIVLGIIGIPFVIFGSHQVVHENMFGKALFVVQWVLAFTACALLLSPSASRWFKSAKAPA